ncbi:hypothetical protein [Wolbachia endosymbiont (group B) of Gerris lacustris]|uniref:hypothetical protein n=1 Tax=Wolbachia endosymbiont (group B) of Gerris lacustris TaxID=3066159 RepID=UPI00334018DA
MTGEISSNSSSLLSAPPPPPPLPPADWVKNCGQAESNDKNEKTSGSIASENSSSTKPTTVLSEGPAQLATEQKIDTPILVNTSIGISKATALKYSIATLLLCISSVTAGIYTYLAISATLSAPVLFIVIASVSSLVVLNLAVYLINSFVSAINSEKGVDPGREQSQDSGLQKAKELEHSNTPIPSFPVMSGIPIVPLLPLPPPSPSLGNNFPSGPATDAGMFAEMKSKTLKKTDSFAGKPGGHKETDALFEEIKKGKNLMSKEERDKIEKKRLKEQEAKKSSNKGGGQQEKKEDHIADLNKVLQKRRAGLHGKQGSNVQQPSNLDGAFSKMSAMISPPRSRSSSVSSSSSEESEQDWSDNESTYSTPLNPQLDNKKRRDSSDSGHESDDNEKSKPTSPLHSVPKAGKPLVPPKNAGLQTKSEASPGAQANNVDPVNNEVQKPSSLVSQKIKFFGEKAHACQLKSVIDRGKSSSAPFLK